MAGGPYAGKDGQFSIGSAVVAYMDSWSLTPAIGTAEVSAFGDNSKAFGQTLREWSGNSAGTLDRTDTDQADLMDQFENGTLADIAGRWYVQTATTETLYWLGNVKMTGMAVNSAVADKVSISFEYQGNGDLSWTCSTARRSNILYRPPLS